MTPTIITTPAIITTCHHHQTIENFMKTSPAHLPTRRRFWCCVLLGTVVSACLIPNVITLGVAETTLTETTSAKKTASSKIKTPAKTAPKKSPSKPKKPVAALPEKIDFGRDIRPILSDKCFVCHGPDDKNREADLRLDLPESALAKLDDHFAILPGKPEKSSLYQRITSNDEDERMPPKDKKQLTAREIALLKAWIQQGAHYAKHWSYQSIKRPVVPTVKNKQLKNEPKNKQWMHNAIDNFVLKRLEQAKLAPEKEANRYALIRRLSLDLIGLPPSIAETDAFVNDKRPDAYERLVDRLLASKHFGERWGRWWLDLARFADSNGYESDEPRDMSLYRDWVIKAFNKNMPFDVFTTKQLAGDLQKNPTQEDLVATGFHRNTLINTEGGAKEDEFKDAAIKDRVETTFAVWMGSTMLCCRCHTHKYDPLLQSEYYQVYSLFNNTIEPATGNHKKIATDKNTTIRLSSKPQEWKKVQAEVRRLGNLAKRAKGKEKEALIKKRKQAEQKQSAFARRYNRSTFIMKEGKPVQAHVLLRGSFLDLGKKVDPGVPQAFGLPFPKGPQNRLTLAKWLLDRRNPRTARVTINRIWDLIFGLGLVKSSEEFGVQGDAPSHPELLDWLAVEFMEQKWDFKKTLKLIVQSATYRQSVITTARKIAADPENRLLSRGVRIRVEAEMLRDISLTASGLLSREIGGRSIFPPQPKSVYANLFKEGGMKAWPENKNEERYRRGLYIFIKRTALYPMLRNFDAGNRVICLIRRQRSNTPLHALNLLNDPAFVEAAGALAQRMIQHSKNDVAKIEFGFRCCATRPPRTAEKTILQTLYKTTLKHFQTNPGEAKKLIQSAFLKPPKVRNANELAAWITIANTLLNMDATVTKGS